MATLDLKKVKSMLKCAICQEVLKDPKTLSCFHSFCMECLKKLKEVKQGEDEGVSCPMCRAFTLSTAIKVNYLVSELLEMHNSKESGQEQLCDQCIEKKPQWKCMDCKIVLCKKCQGIHLRVPLLRGHRVLPINAETEMIIDRLVFCTKHSDQPIVFNCRGCEVPLCIKCKVTQHESHKTETIEDTLERILPEVSNCVEIVKEHITDIESNTEYMESKIKAIKEAFSQCRKQIKLALDVKEQEELQKLEDWLNKKAEYGQLVEWVNTCNQTAKGVSLMGEIQTGLFGKLKNISSSVKMSNTRLCLDFPEFNLIDVKDQLRNVQVMYKPSSVFKPLVVDGRAPPIPYTDMLSKQLASQKEIYLKGRCTRISIIDGNIWAPVTANNIIQIFNLEGEELPSVEFNSGPRSVKQLADGSIVVASDSGMFTMKPDATRDEQLQGTTGAFSDFSVDEEKMVAVNYNQNAIVYFMKTEGKWLYKGALSQQYSTNNAEDTVLIRNEIFLSHLTGNYTMISKYSAQNQYVGYYQSSLSMSYPHIVGSDISGDILIADYSNARFQLYNPTKNQWQLVSNTLVPHGSEPLDLLYDNEGSVWILSSHPQSRLVKYK